MSDELKKYSTGVISATERAGFLNRLRNNSEAKKELACMKAVQAISGPTSQEGDREKTVTGVAEFDKRLK